MERTFQRARITCPDCQGHGKRQVALVRPKGVLRFLFDIFTGVRSNGLMQYTAYNFEFVVCKRCMGSGSIQEHVTAEE